MQFSKESAPKSGENCPISGRRKRRSILSRLWLSWFFRSAFCSTGPWTWLGSAPHSSPTTRAKRDAQHMFLQHRGAHAENQHKHKLIGPNFRQTFLTFMPGCRWVKKFLPTTGAAGKQTFRCRCPRFLARTSLTRRVFEKLRDGEATIRIKFAFLRGGGALGAERKIVPKTLFRGFQRAVFVGGGGNLNKWGGARTCRNN